MKETPISISAVVITYNEEDNIGRCIDSLKQVADEIVVVDCFSTDATKKICLEKGVSFYENEFLGFARQKNFAIQLTHHDYILSLDADEYLSPELTLSILELKKCAAASGYTMNRLSSYGGEWIKTCGWYPDTKLRLWKRDLGGWVGGGIHEWVKMNGEAAKIKHLKGDILHHAYDNINHFLEKIQKYSDIYAAEHRFKIQSSAFKIFYKTTYAFIKSFILKRGILDGYKGLLISVCNANFAFYKYSKLLEANRKLRTSLVISTYNREDALELTLLSVLNQSIMPDEIIIADDGSRPDTKNLINQYREIFPVPLIHCWQADFSVQAGQIRNKAIASSQGDYIIQIDGDMVLHPHFVKSHLAARNHGRFIQGARISLTQDVTQQALSEKKFTFSKRDIGLKDQLKSIFSPWLSKLVSAYSSDAHSTKVSNMSFWKSDFLQINGFNENLVGWGREDKDMSLRLMNSGVKRYNLKLAGFAYHLFHREMEMYLLREDPLLQQIFTTQRVRCENGIDKYLQKTNKKQVAA